jgi:4-hydroxybenzoate polyprenyltransferase
MNLRDLAELVRLPAALTVPGDTLAGAASARWPLGRRTAALPVASVCLYWAGMTLNDYADRNLDAVERPERPIPSGRVTPRQALAIAGGLTATGLAVSAAAGGRRALRVAVPLAATVWAYDLVLKQTRFGPAAMAAARGLDVLLGAGGSRSAILPAAAVAGHTAGVTALSRGEVYGTSRAVAAGALATTLAVATATAVPATRGPAAVASVLATGYAVTVGKAQAAAVDRPDAATVRTATGAGIRGLIPLQAALTARAGAARLAGALLAAGPVAKLASKAVSPT